MKQLKVRLNYIHWKVSLWIWIADAWCLLDKRVWEFILRQHTANVNALKNWSVEK